MRNLILLLLIFSASSPVLAQERSVVVLDLMKLPPKVARSHERLKAAVLAAVAEKGWKTTFHSSIADCQPVSKCVAQAKNSGADYVLTIAGDSNQSLGYDVSLEIISTKSEHRQSASSLCDYCDFDRLVQNVAHSAVDLVEKAEAEAKTFRKELDLSKPGVVSLTPPPLVGASKSDASPSVLPWVTMGVGAVVLSYGTWALINDGDIKGCSQSFGKKSCESYASQTLGYTMVSVGVAAVLGGVAWKLWGTDSQTSLSLSPNQIAFTTRY